jgi:flagellar biosynthetic protein FlhB
MSDASSADKTEKASPQKLRKTREQGQAARSRDLATAVGLLVGLRIVVLLAPGWLEDFRRLFALGFAGLDGAGTLDNLWSAAGDAALALMAKMVLPMAVVPLAVLLAGLVPGGWVLSTSHWMPKFERIDPMRNLARLVQPRHGVEMALALLKAGVLAGVLVHVVRASADDYVRLQGLPLDAAIAQGAGRMLDGLMAMCAVFVLVAAIDVPAQALLFARGQRMTKQEVREEHKSNEGRPEVRQRIRQLQRQIARRSVRKSVPGADVVVVNPEHYAVALKYDERRAQAPFVVAKGVDEMALYIRAVAAEHGIETLELPPLARALYNTSQVQQQIPMSLYRAVAQVLTYVLQLKAFRAGRRTASPALPADLPVPPHLSEVASS